MIRLLAAAAVAASSFPPALVSTAPWWEKVTVTVADDGEARSCSYETSLHPDASKACKVEGKPAALGSKGELTRLTFERRFQPGAAETKGDSLPAGDTLLGRQVLALAIDSQGAVKGCKVVAAGGDMTPDYGCAEAATEKFQATVAGGDTRTAEAHMTILVYAHAEHVA